MLEKTLPRGRGPLGGLVTTAIFSLAYLFPLSVCLPHFTSAYEHLDWRNQLSSMPYTHTFHLLKTDSDRIVAYRGTWYQILYILNLFSGDDWWQWGQQARKTLVSVSPTLPLNREATRERQTKPGYWCLAAAKARRGQVLASVWGLFVSVTALSELIVVSMTANLNNLSFPQQGF